MSTSAATASGVRAPSLAEAAWLVARREVRTRLRSKAFLISTGILVLAAFAGIVVGGILSANPSRTKVAVTSDVPAAVAQQLKASDSFAVRTVEGRADADRLVRSGAVDAAVARASGPLGFRVIAKTDVPEGLVGQLSVTPPVSILEKSGQDALLRYFVALGFGLVFFVTATTFGSAIAQSVVEEKQTRIVEILVAAIPARALLAGKVVGNSLLAFAQIAVLAAISVIGLTITGQGRILATLGGPIVWFAVFFVFGFVLLASMFAATGALVSRTEDIASTTTPVTMLVMAPYLLVVFGNANPLLVGIMSYVPFGAPVGMPLRLYLGTAQWWEPLVALVLLIATTAGMVALGARIYERGLLRMGSRVPWREALRA
ncbi:MAG: ABC transporter permease [Micrococcales bacterium]|nr:ABC transporter permease [Micrococcales bacterium]